MTPDQLRQIKERATKQDFSFHVYGQRDLLALVAEVERLRASLLLAHRWFEENGGRWSRASDASDRAPVEDAILAALEGVEPEARPGAALEPVDGDVSEDGEAGLARHGSPAA